MKQRERSLLHLLSSCGFFTGRQGSSVLQLNYKTRDPHNSRAAMRMCAVLCGVLMLLSQALSGSHGDGSIMIRGPDIDASWYTGRGIRPVGRFGRNVAKRNEHLAFITGRVYRPTADSESNVWITQRRNYG